MGFHIRRYTDDAAAAGRDNFTESVDDTTQSIKCVAHGKISSVVPFPYVLRFVNI